MKEAGVSHSHNRKGKGTQAYCRHVQPSWYKTFPWISVCSSSLKIYCSTCRSAKSKNLLTFPKHYKSAFIDDGFQNLKKAIERCREHENSVTHKEAVTKLVAINSKGTGVDALLSTRLKADQEHHREMLMKLLHSIKYLARQGLPLRGHHEDSVSFEGNLYQLLLLHATYCPKMTAWLTKREYISPDIVNELIRMMGQSLLRTLLGEIRSSLWFAILADEATDVSHHEQLSLSIRWVDDGFVVHEDTLGLVQLPNTTAATIFATIKDILIRCSLPLSLCRGQAFDGASNMSGIRNGVQALVKAEAPQALYVHCLAHNLNLCLKDVTVKCELIRNVMDFVYNLVQLIRYSPKRLALFDTLRKEVAIKDGVSTPSLRTVCPTRWTVRHSCLDSILRNYELLEHALLEIKQGHDEYAAKASGALLSMESFETFFSLKLAYLIFSAAEQLSINLQAKDITIQEATTGASLLTAHLHSLRNEEKFNSFYEHLVKDSSNLTEEPCLPRYRKVPRRFDQGESPHIYSCPKDRYRHAYFEALELASGEVEKRFDQADLQVVKQIEMLLLNAANGQLQVMSDIIPSGIKNYLNKDIDLERLKCQLSLVPDMVKTASEGRISKVTNVRTLGDLLNQSRIYKDMLSEVNKLVNLFFTFPVTTATAERSFSSLRRLKTYLRSRMSDCRLNNLFLMYVHSSRTDALDLNEIAREFISINSKRMHYFGTF